MNLLTACSEVLLLFAISAAAIYLTVLDTGKPWLPIFLSCNDERYRKPVTRPEEQLIPTSWLYYIVFVMLPSVISTIELVTHTVLSTAENVVPVDCRSKCIRALSKTWKVLSSYYAGIFLLLIFCKISRVIGGKPAPYFLTLCSPGCSNTTGSYRDPMTGRLFITQDTCQATATEDFRMDTFSSFPSAHAALSFYSAMFTTAFYCLRESSAHTYLVAPFVAMLVITMAAVASLSRITEYSNHIEDVVCGVGMGCVSALVQVFVVGKEDKQPERTMRGEDRE